MQDALPQLQALRAVNKNSRALTAADPDDIIYVDCHQDPDTNKDFVLWEDILVAFHHAVHVRDHARVVPFLKGADYRTYVTPIHIYSWLSFSCRGGLLTQEYILLYFITGWNRDGLQPLQIKFWM